VTLKPRRAPGRPGRAAPVLLDRPRGRLEATAAGGRNRVWFFDLDNTLHDAAHAIFGAIDGRMTAYLERHLGVGREQANELRLTYWRRYGATMLGLMRHHAVDPHHFLRQTHDFEVAALLRAERGLAQLFARLPGRKVLLTNAPGAYAEAVLRALGLHRRLLARYAIEQMRVHRVFRPKPSRGMLRHMLARERVPRGAAVLVEDSIANLRSARAAGFRTVLVTGHSTARRPRGSFVGLRLRSVRELPRARLRLRG
jgi:putative hydrolase of the HAD superfamily